MILKIILGIIIGMGLFGVAIFLYEIKHAQVIDENEPFLWDELPMKKK